MVRATTPLQEFTFDVDPSTLSRILITYKQEEEIILQKTENDLTFSGNVASFRMSQDEANSFTPGTCRVQVRALTSDGEALAGDIESVRVSDVLNDEVLV